MSLNKKKKKEVNQTINIFGLLDLIRWFDFFLSQRLLCVSFSRTDYCLCILFGWSNFSGLHYSRWIAFPAQPWLFLSTSMPACSIRCFIFLFYATIFIIILLFWEYFTAVFTDGFPLEVEWQQVSSSLQDSSPHSGQS